jgi:Ku protein
MRPFDHRVSIDEFVPKSSIDPRYLIRPYYLVPDGKVGHDAFAVIRETIRNMNMVAIGRVVFTSREHIIGLEPLGKGLVGTLLRYPYEVRDEREYFDDNRVGFQHADKTPTSFNRGQRISANTKGTGQFTATGFATLDRQSLAPFSLNARNIVLKNSLR